MSSVSSGSREFRGTERFVVRRRLGAGGFGVVYEVRDKQRGSVVALKTLSRWDPGVLYRFKQEFRALADLSHPNLVQLYELHAEGDAWFFTMELVDGVDVLDFVRGVEPDERDVEPMGTSSPEPSTAPSDRGSGSGPLAARVPTGSVPPTRHGAEQRVATDLTGPLRAAPPNASTATLDLGPGAKREPARFDESRLRSVLRQLAQGLEALHRAGKLHRDIKPSNVLVTRDGRLVLLDFGLVTETGTDQSIGVVAGTPVYMAPEQANAGVSTTAADWYAVGVVLYEALAGRAPFSDRSVAAMLLAKMDRDPPPPSHYCDGIPADLERLCLELLRRAPDERPTGAEVIRRLGTAPEDVRISSKTAPTGAFIGREAQREALLEAFRAVRETSRGVVALVRGRSGIGKTALVRRVLEELRATDANAVLLSGRCFEQESVPFKAVDSLVDALSRFLRRRGRREADAYLPRDIAALARVFPVLEQVDAVREAPPRAGPSDVHELRRRAAAALRELLARIGDRRPLVIFVDDLQWGDLDSATLLAEVLRPPDTPPLLFVASYRDDDEERSACLSALLEALRGEGASLDVRRVDVAPLTMDESRELAETLLGGPDAVPRSLADAVAKESGGRPFYVSALAQFLLDRGSGRGADVLTSFSRDRGAELSLDEVIAARVDELPEPARRLLAVVAVAGQPIARDAAAVAAEIGADELAATGRLRSELLLRTVTVDDREQLETYHDRIREVVVARLAPDALVAHHQALATVLQKSGRTDPETLAVHWLAANQPEAAATHALAAADEAARALAFDRAARLYAQTLELRPSGAADLSALRAKLGTALMNAGRGREAADAWLAAVPEAGPAEALELRRLAAQGLLSTGYVDRGLKVLGEVLAAVSLGMPAGPWRTILLLALLRTWLWLRGLGFTPSAAPLDDAHTQLLDATWTASLGLSMVDTPRGWYFATRSVLAALSSGDRIRITRALAIDYAYSAGLGGPEPRGTAGRAQRLMAELEPALGDGYTSAIVTMNRGVSDVLRGHFARGERELEAAAEALAMHPGTPWERDTTQVFALLALFWLGRWQDCANRLAALLAEARSRGDLYGETTLVAAVGHLPSRLKGDPDTGRRALEAALAAWPADRFYAQHSFANTAQAELALYAGDAEGALASLARNEVALRRSLFLEVQWTRGVYWDVAGRASVAAAAARPPSDPAHVRHALAARRAARRLRREHMPWITPLALTLEAGIASLTGEPGELLARAEQAAEAAGLGHLLAALRLRLAALPSTPGREALATQGAEWFRQQGVRDPDAVVDSLVPGRWTRAPK